MQTGTILMAALGVAVGLMFVAWLLYRATGKASWVDAFWAGNLAVLALGYAWLLPMRFLRDHANKGRVCRTGLWSVSRHPNYFFEWLLWCSFALMATGAPWGWVSWSAPAMMLYFLVRVTGIPLTEKQAVASQGDA